MIGVDHPCFIIAEMSGNHHHSYDEAVAIIKAAAEAGADAIKLQTYTPDTITLKSDKPWFRVGGNDNPEAWEGKTMHELFQTAYTPWEWQSKLKKVAEDLGLVFFSTAYDDTSVEFLENMGIGLYKVGSYELTHLPLLRQIAKTKKPVILSVGYGSLEEITDAVQALRINGAEDIALLHCVTGYAPSMELVYMHLRNIRDLAERFDVVSGFSENTGGIEVAAMSVLAGASVLEKHVILDKALGGPDATFSIDPKELKELVQKIRREEQALGTVAFGPVNEKEKYNRDWCRESLFVGVDMKKGDTFTAKNVRIVRPGNGLSPKYYDEILGKKAAQDIEYATPLSWDLIEK